MEGLVSFGVEETRVSFVFEEEFSNVELFVLDSKHKGSATLGISFIDSLLSIYEPALDFFFNKFEISDGASIP